MLKGEKLLDYTNVLSLNQYDKNDKIILKCFQLLHYKCQDEKNCGTNFKKFEEFKNPKISYMFNNALGLSSVCDKYVSKDNKMFKEEEAIEILTTNGLI